MSYNDWEYASDNDWEELTPTEEGSWEYAPDDDWEELSLDAQEPDAPAIAARQNFAPGETLGAFGRTVGRIPENLAAKTIMAIQGQAGASVADRGVADRFVNWVEDRNRKLSGEYEGAGYLIPGVISNKDVAELGPNLAFSGASMVGTTGGGLVGGLAGPPGAVAGGMVAGGATAYRMDSYQVMNDWLKKVNQESIDNGLGPISKEEEEKFRDEMSSLATEHGLWEAGPEGLGNVLELALLTAKNIPGVRWLPKGMLGKVAKGAMRFGGTLLTEEATETVTQMGQHNVEVEAGASDEPKREWTSGDDILKSAKEVLPQVLMLSGVMTAGGAAYRKAKTSPTDEVDLLNTGMVTREQRQKDKYTDDLLAGMESGELTPERMQQIRDATPEGWQADILDGFLTQMPEPPLAEEGIVAEPAIVSQPLGGAPVTPEAVPPEETPEQTVLEDGWEEMPVEEIEAAVLPEKTDVALEGEAVVPPEATEAIEKETSGKKARQPEKDTGVAKAVESVLEPHGSTLSQIAHGKEKLIETNTDVRTITTKRGKEYKLNAYTYELEDGRRRIVLSDDPTNLIDAGAIVRPIKDGVVVESLHGGKTGLPGLGGTLARLIKRKYGEIIPDAEAPLSPAGRKAIEKIEAKKPIETRPPDIEGRRKADRRKWETREDFENVLAETEDVEEAREIARQMADKAYVDPLMGISNKAAWLEHKSKEDKLPVEDRQYKSILDLDNFSWVNDVLGHDVGDKVLKQVGTILSEESSNPFRFGGEEFLIAGDDLKTLDLQSKKIRGRVESELILEGTLKQDITLEDGTKYNAGEKLTVEGMGISYGISKDFKEADDTLFKYKGKRTEAGIRSPKGREIQRLRRQLPEGVDKDYERKAEKPVKADKKTYYHGTDKSIKALTTEGASENAAFGKGIYLSTHPEDAQTWGKNLSQVRVKGKILEASEATIETARAFEEHLETERYSNKIQDGKPVTNIELYYALKQKFPNNTPQVLKTLGYIGVEHATPRMKYQGKATNVVIFDPKNVAIISPAKPSKSKKTTPGSGIRTFRGYVKFVGGINFLNFTGELRGMPIAVKYLSKKTGVPIDQFVEMAIAEDFLEPDMTPSVLMETLRTDSKKLLSRDRLTTDLADKKEHQKSAEEKKFEKELAHEPEAPPEGDYIQMNAEDLPVGKKLTLLEGKSPDGWDTYEVVEKDPFSITLKDGTEVELKPLDKVEVLEKDLPTGLEQLREKHDGTKEYFDTFLAPTIKKISGKWIAFEDLFTAEQIHKGTASDIVLGLEKIDGIETAWAEGGASYHSLKGASVPNHLSQNPEEDFKWDEQKTKPSEATESIEKEPLPETPETEEVAETAQPAKSPAPKDMFGQPAPVDMFGRAIEQPAKQKTTRKRKEKRVPTQAQRPLFGEDKTQIQPELPLGKKVDKSTEKGYKVSERFNPYEDKQQKFDFKFKEEKPAEGIPASRQVRMATSGRVLAASQKVSSASDVASLLAHIRKSAQELAYTVTVNKDNTILEIHKYSKGKRASAQISPVELSGRVLNIPDADTVYFVHNHPSGSTGASPSDVAITESLEKMVGLKDVKMKALIIAGTKYRELSMGGKPLDKAEKNIKPTKRHVSLPEKERALAGDVSKLPKLRNPKMVSEYFENVLNDKEGSLFLDAKNRPVKFVKFVPGEPQKTVTSKIVSAAEESNAISFIFKSDTDIFVDTKRKRFLKALGKQMGEDLTLLDILSAGKSLNDSGLMKGFGTGMSIDTVGNYETIGSEAPLYSTKTVEDIVSSAQKTPEIKKWFGESVVTDEKGDPKVVYSGHGNILLWGEKYEPKKATAGAFYTTEDPALASGYATGKLGDRTYFEGGEQYRLKNKKTGKFNKKLWQYELTNKQLRIIEELKKDEDTEIAYMDTWIENNKAFDAAARKMSYRGTRELSNIWQFFEFMGYNIAHNKTDALLPITERQQQNRFEDLLDKIGIKWTSYYWAQPGVMPVILRIENPLDTSKPFPKDLLAELDRKSKHEKNRDEHYIDVTRWTKDYPMKEWVKDIKREIETGVQPFWPTHIPKKALPIIKSFGYDGIKDTGGKSGGPEHVVWMAFEPNQIKSVFNLKPTEDPRIMYAAKKTFKDTDISLEELQKLFKHQKVNKLSDGSVSVKTALNKGFTINFVETITPDRAAFQTSYGRMKGSGELIAGKYQDDTVTISKVGDIWTVAHEALGHWMEDTGFINKNDQKVLKYEIRRRVKKGKWETLNKDDIGGKEDRAEFIAQELKEQTESRSTVQRVMQKIRDLIDALVNLYKRTARGVVRDISSGKIYEKEGVPATEKTAFSVKDTAARRDKSKMGVITSKVPQESVLSIFVKNKAPYGISYDEVSGSGEAYLDKFGNVLLDGTKYTVGEKAYLHNGKFYKSPPKALLEQVHSAVDGATGYIDGMKKAMWQIKWKEPKNKTIKKGEKYRNLFGMEETATEDTFITNLKRYENVDDYHRRYIQEVESLVKSPNADALMDALYEKELNRKRTFHVGGYLHLAKDGQQLSKVQKAAVQYYLSNGGQAGLSIVKAMESPFLTKSAATAFPQLTDELKKTTQKKIKVADKKPAQYAVKPPEDAFVKDFLKKHGVDPLMPEKEARKTKPVDDIPRASKKPDIIKEKFGRTEKTPKETVVEAFASVKTKGLRDKVITQTLDRLHPVKTFLSDKAYKLHRIETGTQAVVSMFLEHGKLKWDDSGFLTMDERKKGFLPFLKGLGKDWDKFIYWTAAKRASELAKPTEAFPEGREKWLSKEDRDEIFDWAGGENNSKWIEASKEFKEFNSNILDIAEKAGLIDPEGRKVWEQDFYVPFYRIFEDFTTRDEFLKAPKKNKRFINAQIRQLKGANVKMGDPLENLMQNWTHLINESLRNVSRAEAFDFAVKNDLDIIEEIGAKDILSFRSSKDKKVVYVTKKTQENVLMFQRNGKPVYFKVSEPELFQAMSNVNAKHFDNFLVQIMGKAKRALTFGATFGPGFRVANLLRDTMHTAMVNKSFKPFYDSWIGVKKAWMEEAEYISLMASGAGFGSSYVRADDPKALNKYIKRIIKKEGEGALRWILNTPEKALDFWEKVGSASENAARVQLYSDLLGAGKTHTEAAFEARDLLDFTMRGESATVQLLIQTVPFLNARMQGLYRLGRAVVDKENTKNFAFRGAILTAASLALWAWYKDDDRWKELEDWDKWAYYHFWIGDKHCRVPKPFEVGAIFSSLPETMADVLYGNEETKQIAEFIGYTAQENFAIGMPQLFSPIIEQWANKSSFTGRPIVGQSLAGLKPGEQKDPWTSETIQLVAGKMNVSPKRAEALIRGYFATFGTFVLGGADIVTRNAFDFPDRPARRIDDYPLVGRFIKEAKPARHIKHVTWFYDTLRDIDESVKTLNHYKRTGDIKQAKELAKTDKDKLRWRRAFSAHRKRLSQISKQIKRIMRNENYNADQKREKIDDQVKLRNKTTKQLYETYKKGSKSRLDDFAKEYVNIRKAGKNLNELKKAVAEFNRKQGDGRTIPWSRIVKKGNRIWKAKKRAEERND